MTIKRVTKLVHEGQYAAEVEVDLIESEEGWSPSLSLDDAKKLDTVRLALANGNLKEASEMGRVYQLLPIAI